MHPDTKLVNEILAQHLLGACVESYGLTHQFLTLTFRDTHTDDHTLWIDTEVISNYHDFDDFPIDDTAKALLLFNKVNLKRITDIRCDDQSTLEVRFETGVTLTLSGTPADKTAAEPWSIGNGELTTGYSIIAMYGGSYSVFGGTS
jgi:hypothetical protein